ncbi:hypothetical protein Q5752_004463 [Cryptotrichosporon argae]
MRLALLSLAVALLASTANAATFAACVDPSAVTSGLLGTVVNVVGTLLSITSSAQCGSYCTTQGTAYSYYQPGQLLGLLATCYCTNAPPPATGLDTGTNSAGSCPSTSYNALVLNIPQTFNGCFGTGLVATTPAVSTTTSTQYQCFTTCARYPVTIVTPTSSGLWTCVCANAYTGGTAGNGRNCGVGVQELYIQNVPIVSGAARKRELALIDARKQAELAVNPDSRYCPRGLSACALPGGAWECIDPMTELESCGGCISPYNATTAVTSGKDCTAIPGATLGGVTCHKGSCLVTSCRSGWELRDGACVRSRVSGSQRRSSRSATRR